MQQLQSEFELLPLAHAHPSQHAIHDDVKSIFSLRFSSPVLPTALNFVYEISMENMLPLAMEGRILAKREDFTA
jgi:hypothetical protein